MNECAICLNNISSERNFAITHCRHKFCFNCIIKSAQINNLCPLCRSLLFRLEENNNEISYIRKIIELVKRIALYGFTRTEILYIFSGIIIYQQYNLLKINSFINIIDEIYSEIYFNDTCPSNIY